jgi:uncharacterized protein
MIRRLLLILALLAFAPAAWAQSFPKADDSGVVDAANILSPAQEQALSAKLIALKKANGRSLVVATNPDIQGYDISDYGTRLLRAWGVGDKDRNDGVILLVAPNDRKLWIVTGYGIEGVVTDALAARITRNDIIPRFKANDYPGGIEAGVDALAQLLALPPDQAKALADKAAADDRSRQSDDGNVPGAIFITLFVIFFVLLPLFARLRGGRHYRRGSGPVILWGPGLGSDWGSHDGGSSWSGGWGGGDSGGGGFFGGGSSGGGGAGGSW